MDHNDDRKELTIIAGMPRAATTFLYHTLTRHPSAYLPARKELEYFSLNYGRGPDWYMRFFRDMAADQVGFDISPMYFMNEHAPDRIRAFNPDVKVILIIRDPVAFVMSLHRKRLATTYKPVPFEDFLNRHVYVKDGQKLELQFKGGSLSRKIERFRDTLQDNLLTCDFKVVQQNPLLLLRAIETFCGIPSFFSAKNFENVKINASDQFNLKLVNVLMQKRWFSDLVVKLVPKKLVMYARYKLQSPRTKASVKRPENERHVALAEEALAADRTYVEELFRSCPFVLGNGKPFNHQSGNRGGGTKTDWMCKEA